MTERERKRERERKGERERGRERENEREANTIRVVSVSLKHRLTDCFIDTDNHKAGTLGREMTLIPLTLLKISLSRGSP